MSTPRRILPILAALLVASSTYAKQDVNGGQKAMRSAEACAMELRAELGLSSEHSFRAFDSLRDNLGMTHVRVDQLYNGVKVLGGDAIIHSGSEQFRNNVSLTENFFRDITLSTTPTLSSAEAIALASQDMAIRGTYSVSPKTELVIKPLVESVVRADRRHLAESQLNAVDMETVVNGYRLAYLVTLWTENEHDGIQEMLYTVDAHSGEIINKYDNLNAQAAKGIGKSQFNGEVELDTKQTASGFELLDTTRGKEGTATYDLANGSYQSAAKGKIYVDQDNTWGDGLNYSGSNSTSDNGQTAAVDAHFGLAASWDFYKNVLDRDGIDGKNRSSYSRVHAGRKWVNACWGASGCFCMTYGDGDTSKGFNVLTSLDVVGHELTHGVCRTTCNLTYSGESGGLNEANSDIGGSMIEYYVRGGGFTAKSKNVPEQGGNFDIGEQLAKKPLRWMHKPSKDGKCPDEWNRNIGSLDVHFSCGPGNRMFYFLSQGATKDGETSAPKYLPNGMTGIGNDKATRIWFHSMFTKFTSSTNYAKAREGCIKAAVELYGAGSAEEAAVHNAFGAVNVGKVWSGSTPSEPPPTEPPSPEKLTIVNHPASQTATVGQTLTFTVEAKGGKAPYKYSWYYNNQLCPEYTTNTLSDECVKENHNAQIYVVVKDAAGASVKSQTATITIQ